MAACLPATAFAAEETETASDEVLEVTMDMMDPDLYDGTWVPFEAGFDLYLPTDWNVLEISEENAKNGMIFLVSPQENAEEAEAALSVQMNDTAGAELTDIAAEYEKAGFTGVGSQMLTASAVSCTMTNRTIFRVFLSWVKAELCIQLLWLRLKVKSTAPSGTTSCSL